MGRQPRHHQPGQYHLVTTRCHQARFFLRPDDALNAAVLEWLTRAQEHFPKLRILAVCVLSNHLHLVVRDEQGDLAAWAGYFFGQFARAVNRLRGRRGGFYERRYSAEAILDDEALLDRLVYVVTNPVAARLCKRAQDWPGVVLFAAEGNEKGVPVSWVDRAPHRGARAGAQRRGEPAPGGEAFPVSGRLVIDPLFPMDEGESGGARVEEAIAAREREIAKQCRQSGRKPMTPKQVLAQSWRAAPRHPKRSPRPLCHAADPGVRRDFRSSFRAFVSRFREASDQFRNGDPNTLFPPWCYPPGRPRVRIASRAGLPAGAG